MGPSIALGPFLPKLYNMKGFYKFLVNTFDIDLSDLDAQTKRYTKTVEDTSEYLEKSSNSMKSFERRIIRQLSDAYDDTNACIKHVGELKEQLRSLQEAVDDVQENIEDLRKVFK